MEVKRDKRRGQTTKDGAKWIFFAEIRVGFILLSKTESRWGGLIVSTCVHITLSHDIRYHTLPEPGGRKIPARLLRPARPTSAPCGGGRTEVSARSRWWGPRTDTGRFRSKSPACGGDTREAARVGGAVKAREWNSGGGGG